jgi:hypothetical protein
MALIRAELRQPQPGVTMLPFVASELIINCLKMSMIGDWLSISSLSILLGSWKSAGANV